MPLFVWQRTIVDAAGNVMPLAEITVRDQVTSNLVQLYKDAEGEESLGNPMTADEEGFVRFYAEGGRYQITASSGETSRVWKDERLGTDGDDIKIRRTAAEIAAGVTPVNYQYEPGKARRLAEGDGTTDDTTALNDAVDTNVTVWSDGLAADYSISASVALGEKRTLRDISLIGDPGHGGAVSADDDAERVLVHGVRVKVEDGGAGGGHGFAVSGGDLTDLIIANSFLESGRFGVLTNVSVSPGPVVDGVIISGTFISSGIGEAIEHNHPAEPGQHFVASGVVLSVETGAAPGAGWAYGLARTEYSVLSGAVIRKSHVEGIHIEDRTLGAVIAGVSGHNIDGHGIALISTDESIGEYDDFDGVPIVGVSLTHHESESNSGHYGIHNVFDTPGSVAGCVLAGTYFRGFDYGYYLGGAGQVSDTSHIVTSVQGVARDCNAGVFGRSVVMAGHLVAIQCPSLAEGSGSASFGHIYSDLEPTAILTRTDSGGPGVYMKGFTFPILNVSHAGGGAENKTLFALPSQLSGRLTVRWEAGANGVFWSGLIKWDGSTLTVISDSVISHSPGNTSVGTPTVSSGDLVLPLTNNTAAVSGAALLVEFDGVFYQA